LLDQVKKSMQQNISWNRHLYHWVHCSKIIHISQKSSEERGGAWQPKLNACWSRAAPYDVRLCCRHKGSCWRHISIWL